ncbi:MAG: radical SAM protein [Candidatus Euphemobacter frigidus]|nr:radical SAM protein [Candidatus Euphemobacter frigidus]MDP8276617.1 radical SAM protein [Candidatus Euphemobacter frigidus]
MVNSLLLGFEVAAARLFHKRIPFFVQLVPTSRCNLNCRYCFGEFHEREGENFPRENLLRIIDELAELGTRFILLTGGEPMMYPHIADIVQRIGARKIELILGTNGLNVAKRIDELTSVDIFSISLDGPRKLHDYYRGAGSYDVAMEAVRAARDRGKRVQLQYTMTRDLVDSFEYVKKVAEEHKCFIGINILRPQRRAEGGVVNPDEASEKEIDDFLAYLIKTRPRVLPYPTSLLKRLRTWPYDYGRSVITTKSELRGYKPIPCSAGRFMVAIDNRGEMYPCAKWFYTHSLGNCADGDIKRAWRELPPVNCLACLDPGFNLLNDTLRFNPASLLGLLRRF